MDLSQSLVPVIHSIRKMLPLSEGDAEEETELIMERLFHLESCLERYEEVELVRKLKGSIAKHILSPETGSQDTMDDIEAEGEVSVQGFRNGLGPIRKAFLAELTETITAVTQDAIVTNTTLEPISSKKHKSGGSLFSSFNFDDLKDFEPLEVVLRKLRDDPNSNEGLGKLMSIEAVELIEHSQWPEVVELLCRAITCATNDADKLNILALHVRLMHSLPEQQSIDLSTNLLKYFWKRWGRWQSVPASDQVADPYRHEVRSIHISGIEKMEISAFFFLIENCRSYFKYCTDARAESIITVIFLLMAAGHIQLASGNESCTYIHILDTVALSERHGLPKRCVELLKCIRPIPAAVHAVSTTLVRTLTSRLQNRSEMATLRDKECSRWQLKAELLDLQLLLTLFEPLAPTYAETLFEKALSGNAAWLWDGTEYSGDEAHRDASNQGLPKTYPLPSFNRLFHQLCGSKGLVDDVLVLSAGESRFSQFLLCVANNMFSFMKRASKSTLSSLTDILYGSHRLVLLHCARHGLHEVLLPSWRACCGHIESCDEGEESSTVSAYMSALQPLVHEPSPVHLISLVKLWVEIASSDYASKALREGNELTSLRSCLYSSWEKLLLFLLASLIAQGYVDGEIFNVDCLNCIQMMTECALKKRASQESGVHGEAEKSASQFLARVASIPLEALRERVLTEESWQRLSGDLLRQFIGCCEASNSHNVFHRALIMRGVLSVLQKGSPTLEPHLPSVAVIAELLKVECEGASAYESISSPFAHLLQLLTTLAYFGHFSLVLRILRDACGALDEFMISNDISTLAALVVHLVGDKRYSLSCEPFHLILLRIMDAALSNPTLAAGVASLLEDEKVVIGDDNGVGVEVMFARTVETKVNGLGHLIHCPLRLYDPQGTTPICAGISTSSTICEVLNVCSNIFETVETEGGSRESVENSQEYKDASLLFDIWASLVDLHLAPSWKNQVVSSSLSGDEDELFSWFSFCCKLLSCASLGSPKGCKSKVVTVFSAETTVSATLSNLAKYTGEDAPLVVLQNTGIPPDQLARHILSHWFVGFLATNDIVFLTAATLIDGAGHASKSLEKVLLSISRDIRSKSGRGIIGIECISVNNVYL